MKRLLTLSDRLWMYLLDVRIFVLKIIEKFKLNI